VRTDGRGVDLHRVRAMRRVSLPYDRNRWPPNEGTGKVRKGHAAYILKWRARITTPCSVPECQHTARSPINKYCAMHYMRVRRHGSAEVVKAVKGWIATNGYKMVSRPNHPLAPSNGRTYEHRLVLFESIGPGTHLCHWCGRPVTWDLSYYYGGGFDALVSDHVDGNKRNNDPSNLVPACNLCNTLRTRRPSKNRHEHRIVVERQ
jgi:hypothetical protein